MFGSLLLLNLLFFFSNHPLVMGLLLMGSTVLVAFSFFLMFKISWFSYLLLLTFLGGLLVLFIYVASLASNEAMKFESKFLYFCIFLLFFLGEWVMGESEMMFWKFYFFIPFSFLIFFLGVYLLFTLLVVVEVTKFEEGPLREMI
uniref:NADH dehydrogenase subunit 6 n=1 Tax=Olivierus martensii TaxID=34649 RepID=A7RAC1_OLIMR|nr:NADH dehydrogenase subunit 6 [Mesobuthus martensii]ABC71916.1 NADH dehydrogenase subunit 6 [Mesobuthus martensii]